jgi:hypothetical protein
MIIKNTLAVLFMATLSSQAVIVTLGGFGRGVTANDGSPIADNAGYVAAGYLSTPLAFAENTSFTPAEQAELISSFQQFGASGVFGQGAFDFASFFQFNADGGRVGAASPALGKNVVMVVGNGADIASSTELAVFISASTFTDDTAAPVPAGVAFPVPTIGALGFSQGAQASNIDTTSLAALVPEPSSALLLGLSALGFVARRKR